MSETADACRDALLGPKRATVLTVDEIREASRALYGDPEHLRIYGMPPDAFTARGIRILGRTAVECTTDPHATAIAEGVEAQMRALGVRRWSVVDLFAGSGNLLYHLAARTSADPVLGFERDPDIFALTRANLVAVGSRARLHLGAFEDELRAERIPADRPCVVCLHPPWGRGFRFDAGLDLRRTDPPTPDIVEAVEARLPEHALFLLHHIHERMVEASVEAVTRGWRIHVRRVTGGSPPGMNSAYLICSRSER